MVATLTSVRLWLGFALLIGIPALLLAILGFRAGTLEEVERRQQVLERQTQIALLVDTSLSVAVSDIEDTLGKSQPQKAGISHWSTLEDSGTLIFWRDRVFFSQAAGVPRVVQKQPPSKLLMLSEAALAAEARGNFSQALAIYARLAVTKELGPWARTAADRINGGFRNQDVRAASQRLEGFSRDALTPDGAPLFLVEATRLSADEAAASSPILKAALSELRSGRWWLSYAQRQLYDVQLRSLIDASPAQNSEDPRLRELSIAEQAIRKTSPFPRDRPARLLVRESSVPVLLVVAPQVAGSVRREGAVLIGSGITAFLSGVMKTAGDSTALAITDSSGRVLWGSEGLSGGRSFMLRAIPGVDLRTGHAVSADDSRRRWLWYGFVALLITMLVLGLVITGRIFRREMELARLQADFAAGVTHEFKSPITGIRLLVERIRGGRVPNPEGLREYCDAIRQEADHLDVLVNRLLETHKIQSGQKRYEVAQNSVTEIAETAVDRLTAQAEARQITIVLDSDDSTREVDVDRSAIQDAIYNLVENAIKYSPPGTCVNVTVRHQDGQVTVIVRDQGIGVDPADLPRIFDRFYRGKLGQARSVSGTGLGLALVKAAAEGHGGAVEAHSQPGAGSEFRFRIPIRSQEGHAASPDCG